MRFSLQRSEMFIATGTAPIFRSVISATQQQNLHRFRQSDCAPTERWSKDGDREAINISPLWGEATNTPACAGRFISMIFEPDLSRQIV